MRMFLEWAKTDIHTKRVREAREIIREYSRDRFYVAVSGGKDSLALLHLTTSTLRNGMIHVFHWDHGSYLMPRGIEHDIINCIKSISDRIILHKLSSRRLEMEDARWNYIVWYRAFYGKLKSFTERHGFRTAFLGIREEESIARRRRGMKVSEIINGITLVYPIHSWSWMDVWAYLFSNKIRFPKIYYELVKIYGWDRARLVTFFDKEFEHLGNVTVSKFILPEEMNKK